MLQCKTKEFQHLYGIHLFSTPAAKPLESRRLKFADDNLKVNINKFERFWALKGCFLIWEGNKWNKLIHTLKEIYKSTYKLCAKLDIQAHKSRLDNHRRSKDVSFVIVTDIGILNLRTDICNGPLNFLDTFNRMENISSILNHNTIKIELQRRVHLLMVNGPSYMAKMIQTIEAE